MSRTTATRPGRRVRAARHRHTVHLHTHPGALERVIGGIAGLLAAALAWGLDARQPLLVVTYAVASTLVTHLAAAHPREPGLPRRLAYAAVLPVATIGSYVVATRLAGGGWLSALVALLAGGAAHVLVGWWLFPDILADEQAEQLRRAGFDPAAADVRDVR